MLVRAVFEVERQIVLVNAGSYRRSVSKCIGYAVFENGEMISPIFGTFGEAEAWMQDKVSGRKGQHRSGPGI